MINTGNLERFHHIFFIFILQIDDLDVEDGLSLVIHVQPLSRSDDASVTEDNELLQT